MSGCPNCGAELKRTYNDRGIHWTCPSCSGRAVGMGPLRRLLTKNFVNAVWNSIEGSTRGKRLCPICAQGMHPSPTDGASLDVCRSCQIVWFDPREFESAPALPQPKKLELSDEQLEPIARMQAEEIAREWRTKPGGYELSGEDLLLIPGVLGMPVEEEATVVNRLPLITWWLAAVILVTGAISLTNPDFARDWSLIPALAFRRGGLTFVTSFFVHLGFLVLLTNLYFLMVFGDNVEDFLGRLNFVLLIFVGALVGGAAHALWSPERLTPFAGAGAGISAITVFYGLRFPQAKLRYFRLYRWFTMPAIAATGVWALSQLLGAREQLIGAAPVSVFAFVGGAVVGLLFWFLWRKD